MSRLLPLLALWGCARSEATFVGQLTFRDQANCSSPAPDQQLLRKECDLLLRAIDPATGAPRVGGERGDFLRPLPAVVDLMLSVDGEPCDQATVQTTPWGTFDVSLEVCGGSGEAYQLRGIAHLQYVMVDPDSQAQGSLHAVWPLGSGLEHYQADAAPSSDALSFTRGGETLGTPYVLFDAFGRRSELGTGFEEERVVDVGNQVIFGESGDDDAVGMLRETLSAWATVIELHHRIREAMADDAAYLAAFYGENLDSSWNDTHLVDFAARWGPPSGRVLRLGGPDRSEPAPSGLTWPVSDVAHLTHEIGLSWIAALQPDASPMDPGFAGAGRWPDGANVDRPSYDLGHTARQTQELATAWTHGVASGLGQYLLNACEGATPGRRVHGGGAREWTSTWSGDGRCDDGALGCSMHHVREGLLARGVDPGSDEAAERVAALRDLAARPELTLEPAVMSHQERRIAAMVCDLLDTVVSTPQTSYRGGVLTAGLPYVVDAPWLAAEALDGRLEAPIVTDGYPLGAPGQETAEVPIRALLDDISTCCTGAVGRGEWGSDYNAERLSLQTSPWSPQLMLDRLVSSQQLSRLQAEAVLMTNFMELPSP